MTINPNDTIAEVTERNAALFSMGIKEITEQIKNLPAPDYVPLKRRWWLDRRIKARSVGYISIGELDVINSRDSSERYFINTLGVMLGLIHFEKHLPDGSPDWEAGWEVDEQAVGNLCFIRAFRYYLQCQKEVDAVAKKWAKLGAWNKNNKRSNRPNRGMASVCRQYCQDMNGAVKRQEAWNVPWVVIYEAFESRDFDNKEQHETMEEAKRKSKSKR